MKSKNLFSRIRYATEKVFDTLLKDYSGMGVLNKYAMKINIDYLADEKTARVFISWLHLLTKKFRIKLKHPYIFILTFVRLDIIIGRQIDIQLGKDGLNLCGRNKRMIGRGIVHILFLACGDTVMQKLTGWAGIGL